MSLKWNEKLGFLFIFTIVIASVIMGHVDLKYYQGVFTREDGFVEWLTVIALLSGAATNFYRAKILSKFRPRIFIFGLIALGCVFIFGAGEEISWGQRIFNWSVPGFFQEHNAQGETNLHNLIYNGVKINKLVFGLILGIIVALYFLVLPFLYRKYEKVKNLINMFAIPIPRNVHIVAYLILFGLVQLIPGHKHGEVLEFGGCWIFYFMTLEPFNREMFSRKSFSR